MLASSQVENAWVFTISHCNRAYDSIISMQPLEQSAKSDNFFSKIWHNFSFFDVGLVDNNEELK